MQEFKRQCPVCKKDVFHKNKNSFKQSSKRNSPCQSCSYKIRIDKYGCGNFKKYCTPGCNTGKNNPFFGKTHSEETKEKIRNRDKSFFKTKEYKEKQSKNSSGSNNAMYGKTVYEVWVAKYGTQKADELLKNLKIKQSKNSSGENNPMYGKPSPQGSGNGWSGWYNKKFFRSIRELSYMVSLDKAETPWSTAEHIKIPYHDFNGVKRTYRPDFLVTNELIEVKPTRLRRAKSVILKEQAAITYCSDKNLVYKVIDPLKLSDEEIKHLVETKLVIFTERYKKMFDLRYS